MDAHENSAETANAPEPDPPPKKRQRKARDATKTARPAQQFVTTYQDLGPMPADQLAMNAWVHQALGVAFRQVTQDPGVKDEKERRKEMCDIAAQMKGLVPQSRIFMAESAVLNGAQQMTGESGPEMVNATSDERGAASGGRQARRGRPRKRSHG